MMESSSPVICVPSLAKRCRYCNIWSRCIICQKITLENLASSTEKGIPSFLNAVAQRQAELCRRLVQEFGSLENVVPSHIKYHKKCVRSYTSKQNLKTFAASKIAEQEVPVTKCDRSEKTQTHSKKADDIDWSCCVFSKKKTFKKERKLHCVSSYDSNTLHGQRNY